MLRRLLAPLLLAAWALPAAAQDAEPAPSLSPLLLDGETSLEVDPSPGLALGPACTIELVLATAWDDEDGVEGHPGVLGRRTPADGDDPEALAAATQWSVHITPDRRAIGLFDGRYFGSVPFDFSDGELHHVALVTKAGRTTVYVDRRARGVIELGPGPERGLPLHVGSSDGGSELFIGAIASLRLWRRALGPEEVAALADVLGAPPEGEVGLDPLAAYSDFTGEGPAIVVLEEIAVPEAAPVPPLPEADGVAARGPGDPRQRILDRVKRKQKGDGATAPAAANAPSAATRKYQARTSRFQQATPRLGGKVELAGRVFRVASIAIPPQRVAKRAMKVARNVSDYAEKSGLARAYEAPPRAAAAPPPRPPPRPNAPPQ
ncbi:MAG: LamG domain-containing protein [Myxococcota bacterium]